MNVKYLVPRTYGRYLEKATYSRIAGNETFYFHMTGDRQPKIPRKDIVIDLPPRKGSLRLNDAVLMPVEYRGGNGANDKCGPKNNDMYLNGTFLATEKVKGKSFSLVKSVYKRKYIEFVPYPLALRLQNPLWVQSIRREDGVSELIPRVGQCVRGVGAAPRGSGKPINLPINSLP